ncbi:DUF7344 domain-containing protein [Halomarina ordinaria]|uniref:DUF7344 domain-containing protein n=1 Tax=Halomarina ordinaria TaxID=3033939 RepID=A0ABD5UDN2_9EURY|nr:hypothetical protein [Halomarina sp. PSRA2]
MSTNVVREERTLAESDVYNILQNDRRRYAIEQLRANGERAEVATLAEAIATVETGESPPPRNVRQSVYNSLHQSHLPKLDAAGVVEYDRQRKVVTLTDLAVEVERYMGLDDPQPLPWADCYVAAGLAGLAAVTGACLGLPGLAAVPALGWAAGGGTVLVGLRALQWRSDGAMPVTD